MGVLLPHVLRSRKKLYTPPPLPPISGQKAFSRGGGVGRKKFEAPRGRNFIRPPPPLLYTPTPRRVFSGVGGVGVYKIRPRIRCLGARDSNHDPLANRIASESNRAIWKNLSMCKRSKDIAAIRTGLGALIRIVRFKSLRTDGYSQEPKRTHKAKNSHEQHQRIFWTFLGGYRSLPNKTRVLRQITPESSPERSAKSLSHSFFVVLFLSPIFESLRTANGDSRHLSTCGSCMNFTTFRTSREHVKDGLKLISKMVSNIIAFQGDHKSRSVSVAARSSSEKSALLDDASQGVQAHLHRPVPSIKTDKDKHAMKYQ